MHASFLTIELSPIEREAIEISFNDLYHELAGIGGWHRLCLALNVTEGIIDQLQNSKQGDEEKKSECLRAYHNSGEATWEGVIAAIANPPISNCRVANKIARNYNIASNPCQMS